MRKTKAIHLTADQELIVRELTPREIDGLFDAIQPARATIVDNLLEPHDLDAGLLAAMCGLDRQALTDQLLDLVPSAWAPLIDAARELNPDFFAMARALQRRAGDLAALEQMLARVSADASVSASSTAITGPGTTA